MNIRTLRGQSEIVVEARRQREEALHQSQENKREVLGLGGSKATQERDNSEDKNDLSSTLEKAIDRGGKINK